MTKLKPFQRTGVRAIYNFRGRALLADDQGLGKTIQALYWVKKIKGHRPVIIVAPSSMKYTWQVEASLFGMRAEVLEGRRRGVMTLPGDIIILNYDILASWLPALLKANPRCVILDEIHYCKNLKAARTIAACELVDGVASVIGISGTPLTNRPIELWPILRIVNPAIFPCPNKYAWRYCKPRRTPWGWQFDGAVRLPELHRILKKTCMIRRLKQEVLPELPDKTRKTVFFRLKSYVEYDKAHSDFLGWLKGISPARAARAKKNPALTRVGYLLRLVAQLKLEQTEKWIEEFFETHPGEKLVALTMHTFVIDQLKEKFRNSVIIDGRVTGRMRHETVRKFQSNTQVDLLLGNWKAAGLGITLTAAHQAVALDLPWTPGDLLQGEDRIHRIGQKKQVTIHYLTTLHTIEDRLVKILKIKARVLDAILNGYSSSQDLNIFEELFMEIKKDSYAKIF